MKDAVYTNQLKPFQHIVNYVLDIYKTPETFCQKVEARDKEGEPVTSLDSEACSWCLGGALYRAAVTLYGNQTMTLYYSDLSDWFDENLEDHSVYTFEGKNVPYMHISLNDEYGYDAVVAFLKEMQKKLKDMEEHLLTVINN